MKCLKWAIRIVGTSVIAIGLFLVLGWLYLHPKVSHTPGIVYGERNGTPLVLDVIRPDQPNGLGVAVLVSGGWKSKPGSLQQWLVVPMLRSGYTVFAVSHHSQPDCPVQDIVQDIHRAIRYIRHHAATWEIDPNQIGISGGSSGGHLSLMIATTGGPGKGDDPVDQESSAVQAAAVFFPVTNLWDMGTSNQNLKDGGPPKDFKKAFGPAGADLVAWAALSKQLSPLYLAHANQPPVMIAHGDADELVPLEQSEWFVEASQKVGRKVRLDVKKGAGHAWLTILWDVRNFAKWFDQHLVSQAQ